MKERILLVDDELDFFQSFNIAFGEKYHITYSNSIESTLAILQREHFDLLLIDLNLDVYTPDELEGIGLIEQLKKSKKYGKVPIIGVSNFFNRRSIIQATRKAGAEEILRKSSFDMLIWSDLFNKTIAKHHVGLKAL